MALAKKRRNIARCSMRCKKVSKNHNSFWRHLPKLFYSSYCNILYKICWMIKISSSGIKLRFESPIILIWIMFLNCNSIHCRNSYNVFVKSNWSMKWIWSLDHSFSFLSVELWYSNESIKNCKSACLFGTFLVLYGSSVHEVFLSFK